MALDFLRQPGAAAGAHPVGAGVHDPITGASAVGAASLQTPGLAAMPDGGLNGGGFPGLGLGGGMLTGSAFTLDRETGTGGFFSAWGRGARSHFMGRAADLSLNGDVCTSMFGADYAKGAGRGSVARAQPVLGRLRWRRHRRGGLFGDGPLPLDGLQGDRPRRHCRSMKGRPLSGVCGEKSLNKPDQRLRVDPRKERWNETRQDMWGWMSTSQ